MNFIKKWINLNSLVIVTLAGLLVSCSAKRSLGNPENPPPTPSNSPSTASKLNVAVSYNAASILDRDHPNSQFTITNTSDDNITFNNLTVSNDVSTYFSTDYSNCISDSSSSLSAGGTCTVNVSFKNSITSDGKSHSYNFNLSYNDPSSKNIQSPTIIGNDTPDSSSSFKITDSLDTLNSSNISSTYTIQNTSSQDVTLTKIVPSDSVNFTTDFSNCISGSSATLATGNSCIVVVNFINSTKPTGKSHKYNFKLYYNDIKKPTIAPTIIGNNNPIPPTKSYITAVPNLYTLDSSHPLSTYIIKNTSDLDVQLNSITVPDDFNNYFKTDFSDCMIGTTWKILTHVDGDPTNTCKVIVTLNTPINKDGLSHQYYFSINYGDTSASMQSEIVIGNDDPTPVKTPTFAYITNLGTLDNSGSQNAVSKCNVLNDGSFSDCKDPGRLGFKNALSIYINNNYAYTLGTSNNSISQCSVLKDGSFSDCKDSGGSGFNVPESISINNNYAYIINGDLANSRDSSYDVSLCTVLNDGSLYNCKDAGSPNLGKGFGYNASYISIKNKFAYITYLTRSMNNEIWKCTISNDGSLSNCNNTSFPGILLGSVFINNNNAYIPGNTFKKCTISANDGSFSNCNDVPLNGFTSPYSMSFHNNYAYITSGFSFGPPATTVSQCTVLKDGSLSGCVDSKGTGLSNPANVFFYTPLM